MLQCSTNVPVQLTETQRLKNEIHWSRRTACIYFARSTYCLDIYILVNIYVYICTKSILNHWTHLASKYTIQSPKPQDMLHFFLNEI